MSFHPNITPSQDIFPNDLTELYFLIYMLLHPASCIGHSDLKTRLAMSSPPLIITETLHHFCMFSAIYVPVNF